MELAGVVILAGGESSRMGSPKALLSIPTGEAKSEHLLDFHIRHAKKLTVPIMVADNSKGFCQQSGVRIIQDYLPYDDTGKGAGALSAIAGAMACCSCSDGYLLVIGCDCLIGAKWLFERLNKYDTADVIYCKGEKEYPLLGLYRIELLPELQSFLDNGNRSVMQFLSHTKTKTVELPSKWAKLANFNTMQEFELALQHLEHINLDGDLAVI